MPWHIHLSGVVHLSECDLRGGADLPVVDLHRGADLRRIGSDLLAESNLPDVSVVRRDADLPH